MTEHPPSEWLTGFMLSRLGPDQARLVIAHLLRGCRACLEHIAPLAEAMFRPGQGEVPDTDDGDDYDDPIGRTFATVLGWKRDRDRERQETELKVSQLLYRMRAGELPGEPGFWTWSLCELLLEKSWSLRHDDPKQMLHLADLARQGADLLNADEHGKSATFDLRARAWGEYANACRVADDLVQAEQAISRALELRWQGSGSDLLRARLAELTAGILCHQRKFPAAFQALDLAYRIHQRHGDVESAARVLVQRGIYTGRSGDPEQGLSFLGQALRQVEDGGDSKLRFLILHNMLLFRVERGEYREAGLQLFEMRPLYAHHAGAVDLVKLRWIEGKIAVGLGELERAERAFQQVREEFENRGQVYHSAVAGLELAAVWLRQGKTGEVKSLVTRILEVFRSRYVARESIAALLMLRDALERDRATLELVTLVSSVIEQHQVDALENGVSAL
jgi:tetratricopeptide (TPR) repeat protein